MAFDSVESVEVAVDRVLAAVTGPLVVATPLGLGKPNRLINALYRRVKDDPARPLTLYTALSLERPRVAGGLEGRFAGPFIERHFGADYPDLAYLADIRAGTLPMHVDVREFYMQSGAMLRVERAQRSYTSLNYTHVSRELASRGVNLMLQMVARRGDRLSFSSNSDTTLDLLDHLRRQGKPRPYVVCVVHPDLPFLDHDEPLPLEFADLLVEKPGPAYRLFALPRASVAPAEFALGLHASALVRDGGTLQIGIGALSDALVHGLILRQRENTSWRQSLEALRNGNGTPAIVRDWGGEGPLADGLYGASEMVMDGFMHLREAGILRRRVWDFLPLEQALADRAVSETLAPGALEALLEYGAIPHRLDPEAVERLTAWNAIPAGSVLEGDALRLADGRRIGSDLTVAEHCAQLDALMAGRRLRGGRWLHGGFFLGTRPFYQWLQGLSGDAWEGLCMARISHINELYGGAEELHRLQRRDARYFNTCMMQTLLGAAVSDALDDGQVVSGVGGQYNFVAMAHATSDGRSVLMLRATREVRGRVESNIVWNYGHTTIPRHLRDVVVTEYGVADIRGASDEECIQRLLAICDSRFQDALADKARAAGKLARDWRIPEVWRRNTPEHLAQALAPLAAHGLLPRFPFGTDLDGDEMCLLGALEWLKRGTATPGGRLRMIGRGLMAGAARGEEPRLLQRLALQRPNGLGERLMARLVQVALRATRVD